jgi:hypothetical protein
MSSPPSSPEPNAKEKIPAIQPSWQMAVMAFVVVAFLTIPVVLMVLAGKNYLTSEDSPEIHSEELQKALESQIDQHLGQLSAGLEADQLADVVLRVSSVDSLRQAGLWLEQFAAEQGRGAFLTDASETEKRYLASLPDESLPALKAGLRHFDSSEEMPSGDRSLPARDDIGPTPSSKADILVVISIKLQNTDFPE